MNNVKSLLNMLCAVDLRHIFVPKAKTILLVKQRLFYLLTDLTNTSYSLLKMTVTQTYLVNCGSFLVISFFFLKTIRVFFSVILSQKV